MTTFDREVYSAVASLYIADGEDIYKLRHVYVTPREVYQILSGNKKNQTNPTPGILQEISQSLERMSLIRVSINAQAEYDKKLNIKASFTDYLLNTSRERIEINGQLTECIQINTPPILFRYASGKNQIARADIKMLNVPVSNTKDNISLKGFLVRRVGNIKNKKSKIGNVIRYDSIYEYLDVKPENFKTSALYWNKRAAIRKATKIILDDWKKEGFITIEKKKTGILSQK